MFNIGICEDTQQDIVLLKEHISQYWGKNPLNIKTYSDGAVILEDLKYVNYDIIFMDIVINDDNGIDITAEINRLQPNAQIIYQSSNIEFFKSVYRTSHMYFLLKPIKYEDFSKAVEKALRNLEKQHIIIRGKEKIRCDDIIYIELVNHDSVFYLKNGNHVSARIKTNALLELLPKKFTRCHKSFIVNMETISSYKAKKHVIMENKQVIPIGSKYANDFNEKLLKYWGDCVLC